jgi:hypothetical protein
VGNPVSQHAGFARTRAGNHHYWTFNAFNRFALRFVKFVKYIVAQDMWLFL